MDTFTNSIEDAMQRAVDGSKDMAGKAEKTIDSAKAKTKEFLDNSENGVKAGERSEGAVTKRIESVTSKIPSSTFLSLAVASIGIAAVLRFYGRKDDAQFVGHWVPTILTLGLYNKLVKLQGSE